MIRARDLEGAPPELGLHRAQEMIGRAEASVMRGLRARQAALPLVHQTPGLIGLIQALDRAADDCVACVHRMSQAWAAERSILPDIDALEAAQARFEAEIDALAFAAAPVATETRQ